MLRFLGRNLDVGENRRGVQLGQLAVQIRRVDLAAGVDQGFDTDLVDVAAESLGQPNVPVKLGIGEHRADLALRRHQRAAHFWFNQGRIA